MAVDSNNETRSNPTYLPFNPGREFEALQKKYGRVDRYLFRLFDKNSKASTDKTWVKSNDARHLGPNRDRDIFTRADRDAVAQALRRHLLGEIQPREEDHFVSWSSSLLSLLQYTCHKTRQAGDHSPADTFICVVDTTTFPAPVFMSDMFLISAFSKYDTSTSLPSASKRRLSDLQSLRHKKHPDYAGSHYYGEYLSQGAMRVKGNCSIVSFADISNTGLYTLRPELSLPIPKGENWAVGVIKLREKFNDTSSRRRAEDFEIETALRIGEKYGPSWKLPVALAFLTLKPRRAWDEGIMEAFRPLHCKF